MHRCLSIPVALHAALKHPSQLLGSHGAAALKAYHARIEEFNKELGALPSKEGQTLMDVAPGDVESQVSYLGIKRKRVD